MHRGPTDKKAEIELIFKKLSFLILKLLAENSYFLAFALSRRHLSESLQQNLDIEGWKN